VAESMHFTKGWPVGPTPSRQRRLSKDDLAARQRAIEKAPMFAGLSTRHLRALARAGWLRTYPAGADIIEQGRTESSFVVILEGEVKVTRGGRTVARGSAGDFFGEISLLDPGPRSATVTAETPAVCLDLAGQDFRRILREDSTLAVRLLTEMARRFREVQPPLA
jgi:CRP/FNR family transcriptional regulator, cyclic AMP receptor protein